MKKVKLMLVETDNGLANTIKHFLDTFEFSVTIINDCQEAEKYVTFEQPDIVVLETVSQGINGLELCQRLRPKYHGLILVQNSSNQESEQMIKLGLGADDYMVKPRFPRALLSRVRLLLRKIGLYRPEIKAPSPKSSNVCSRNGLSIDLSTRSVSFRKQPIPLTTAEYELLKLLACAPGQLVTRDSIIQQIRGYEYDGLDRSVDRRVSRLRKKLQDDPSKPQFIKTIRGKGYQLCL